MEDILTSLIGIAVAAILMFIFPLMISADRADDLSQLVVDIATTEFIDEVRSTGKMTRAAYDNYVDRISTTGNTYNIEMEIKILDENPFRAEVRNQGGTIMNVTQNFFYSVYTSQIEERLDNNDYNNEYNLKEGDIVSVTAKNTNLTLKQQLNNLFYLVTGNETYTIASSHTGVVVATGI